MDEKGFKITVSQPMAANFRGVGVGVSDGSIRSWILCTMKVHICMSFIKMRHRELVDTRQEIPDLCSYFDRGSSAV